MFGIILNEFSNLFLLIILFFVTILIISGIFALLTSEKRGFSEKDMKLHGMFVGMNKRSIAMLSAITLRAFLIIFSVCIYNKNIIIYLFMIVVISLLYIILRFDIKGFVFEVINTMAQLAAIYFVSVLKEYIFEINNEYIIIVIKNFLIIFIVMYTIYSYLRNFEDLISRNSSKKLNLNI